MAWWYQNKSMDDVSIMKICVLASGSKGNSSYIETNNTKVLIDIGTRAIYIEQNLQNINIDPHDICGIVITHTHVDHIQGLKVFTKKYHTKVYLTKIMYDEITECFPLENYEIIDDSFDINDIHFDIIKLSHDAADSNGYIISDGKKSIVYITDTGYIHKKYHSILSNKNLYIIESNHDVEKLMNGKYPYHLKQRILGSKGHLSNEDTSNYLSDFIGDNTKDIMLIHLSEENNTETLAYNSLKNILDEISRDDIKIIISKQDERTVMVEI